MTKIKKLRLHGFKSFAKLIELEFSDNYSTIIGPNGSGKSNLTDAICFVLGRLSAKSMRAEKASNLIYNGGKNNSPAKQAEVSIIFDNSKNEFPIKENEIKITRIVKQNGQSVYKLNDNTITRQQILDLLATAKIDPDGHNIILQGDIVKFMEMRPEDRREIIEEVSGISVYEDKKHKAMLELQKVEEKLKEADIILTERSAHLRELKKDRDQATKYKDLQKYIRENKATYLTVLLKEKEKTKESVDKEIEKEESKKLKIQEEINLIKKEIEDKRNEIKQLNQELLSRGGKDQIEIHHNLEDVKTELTKNTTRLELLQNEITKIKNRKETLKNNLDEIELRIKEFEQQKKEFEKKKSSFEKNKPKQENIDHSHNIIEYVIQKVRDLNLDGVYGTIENLGKTDSKYNTAIEVCAGNKYNAIVVEDDDVAEKCINHLRQSKIGTAIFLPLNKIRPNEIRPELRPLLKSQGVHGLAIELVKFNPRFKQAFMHVYGSTLIVDDISVARKIGIGRARIVTLEGDLIEFSGAMIGGYRRKFSSGLTDLMQIDTEIRNLTNQQNILINEKERTLAILKEQDKELFEFENEIKLLNENIKKNETSKGEQEKLEKKFYEDFKDLSIKRDKLNELIQNKEISLIKLEENIRNIEQGVNNIALQRARTIAELEGLQKEFEGYKDEKIKTTKNLQELLENIRKSEVELEAMGNVNMRALEVYEEIEKEYGKLLEKKEKLNLEKQDVFNLMNEIESKKGELFMRTLNEINDQFKRIFNSLSSKGVAFLELEDKQNPFNGGLDIKVKISGNKYLDIKGLSGGEKTLTALAFIFAIQELQPASFYLLDEVDAALDKTNSEKLSKLIAEYSSKAQYIMISHNDSMITEANQIYGVSMQDGVSKVIGLKV
ncbi:MAG: chromosome segregation SMC family protein [Nanoarchaeota archaeon]